MSVQEVIPGALGEARSASTAGGGTALTTAAVKIVLPRGTKQITLIPRNYSTAVVVKWNKNPWITVLKTTDLLATSANVTDYSSASQDNSTGTVITLSSLDTIANSGALYVGSHVPFSGVTVDVQAANSNAAVLTVKYWNGSAWTDTSATDGTASGGATFAIDGDITWTVPTAWQSAPLNNRPHGDIAGIGDTTLNLGVTSNEMFWTRWQVSAALDSSTTCNSLLAINRDTTYAEIPSGITEEQAVNVGPGGICSVTALTDAGTANLIVNVQTRNNGRF